MVKPAYRISSIDLLRGLVMIIMALDHVRDYFHNSAMVSDPMDLETTTPALFFTRWITHYCAPVFVFLSGLSAYLSGQRKTKQELSLFLLKRGLWLVVIEVTVVGFGWAFNPFFNTLVLQVIWAIGVSMIALGVFCHLPYYLILSIAILIICGHNSLDSWQPDQQGNFAFLWNLLHQAMRSYEYAPHHRILVIYPVLPWIGIMMLGYCFGRIFSSGFDASKRRMILLSGGIGMILCFVVLRNINDYGDMKHWNEQRNALYTFLSFLHVTKYPPSLLFTCMTIGPGLLFLAFTENARSRISSFITIFGRVPFFYYILHIYTIHILTVILFFLSGYGVNEISSDHSFFNFRPPDFGYDLWLVYIIWILLIMLLYFPCRWYNTYKSSHSKWWLHYV